MSFEVAQAGPQQDDGSGAIIGDIEVAGAGIFGKLQGQQKPGEAGNGIAFGTANNIAVAAPGVEDGQVAGGIAGHDQFSFQGAAKSIAAVLDDAIGRFVSQEIIGKTLGPPLKLVKRSLYKSKRKNGKKRELRLLPILPYLVLI